MAPSSPPRRALVLVFLLCFAFYAYFHQGGGPNQFSRLALAGSLAREGTVRIDTAHHLTIDKAKKDGHFYSDKAPGLSFLAAPVYWLMRLLLSLFGQGFSPREILNWILYGLTVVTVSLPVALAMASFYRRAWQEAGPAAAFWVTLALGVGSPLAVYAGLFYGHALCAALLWLAFVLVTPQAEEAAPGGPPPDADAGAPLWRFGLAGFLAGWATLTEMPTAIITAALFVHVWLSQPQPWKAAAAFVAGGLPCAALLFVYNTAAFGGPLENGYQYCYLEHFREAMSQGIMGVTGPTLESVEGVFIGGRRGLLWHWPFFFLCVVPALVMLVVRRELRGPALLSAVVVVAYLLFACSYFQWDGGWSFGPRHVIPCLPFAAYLVVRAYQPAFLWVMVPAALVSSAVAFMAVATIAELPEDPRITAWPLLDLTWPMFWNADLSIKVIGPLGQIGIPARMVPPGHPAFYDACNLGEALGLRGLLSLVPLLALMLALGVALAWAGRQRDGPPG